MSTHGKATWVVMNTLDISNWLNQIDTSEVIDTAETSGFQQNAKTYVSGLEDATATFSGRFQGAAASVETLVREQIPDDLPSTVTLGWGMGLKRGNSCVFGETIHTGISVSSATTDVTAIAGDLQFNDSFYWGWLVADLATYTATGTTTTLDLGAATSGEMAAVLHVILNDADDETTVRIEHSTNGTVWADLTTFTVLAAADIGVELKQFSSVNRYVRVGVDFAGAGDIRALVALGQR